jgi:hypothetical protein
LCWTLLIILQALHIWRAYPIYTKYEAIGWSELSLFDTGLLVLGAAGVFVLVALPFAFLYRK